MANNLKSFIAVKGNEEVMKLVDSLIDKVRNSEDDNVVAFATAFYDDVELSEDGGSVMISWSNDNLGAKWTTFYDEIGAGEFSIESAWYPPSDLLKEMHRQLVSMDSDVIFTARYWDEAYDPIGVIKITDSGQYVTLDDYSLEYVDSEYFWDEVVEPAFEKLEKQLNIK